MKGFNPSQFTDYDEYRKHRDNLERTQRLKNHIFEAWNSISNLFPPYSGYYIEIQELLEGAVQLGYEAALGMPHKATDYDIDERTLDAYQNKCHFCKHHYLIYGYEDECILRKKRLPCKLEVKEYID